MAFRQLEGCQLLVLQLSWPCACCAACLDAVSSLATYFGKLIAAVRQGPGIAGSAGAESRAELLAVALCAVLLLVGLQWLSVKPRPLTQVVPT